jgi:hypothetical protein
VTPCSRCQIGARLKNKSWCRACTTEHAVNLRRKKRGTVPGHCRCGRRVLGKATVCAECAAGYGGKRIGSSRRCATCGTGLGPRGKDPLCYQCRKEKHAMPERARCQAQGCDLPTRGEARGCAMHWPTFEREAPPLEESATRGWGVWV